MTEVVKKITKPLHKQELKKIISNGGDIKDFDCIGVSTKTIIAISNLQIELDKFYQYIPIVEYTQIEKKRGRKKRSVLEQPVKYLPEGSVVLVQRRKEHRGCLMKKKKSSSTFFLHSVTVVLMLQENKQINIKVSSNGKFQITGCKTDQHYIDTMMHLFYNMQRAEEMTGERLFRLKNSDTTFQVVFNTVMQNMDFNIGFNISRDKLDRFINTQTDFISIYEGSIRTCVNVKIEAEKLHESELVQLNYDTVDKKQYVRKVAYTDYYTLLEKKERKCDINKEKHHTFLIFASGSIILSSRGPDMKRVFYKLIHTLLEHKHQFVDTTIEEEQIIKEVVPLH
jgi:hypothetical protein